MGRRVPLVLEGGRNIECIGRGELSGAKVPAYAILSALRKDIRSHEGKIEMLGE